PRPKGQTVYTEEEALKAGNELGYPVLLRPSYVLGGQNMIIAYNDADVSEYMKIITAHELENPVLIDKYLMGIEVEVDAISDGEDFLIPGIMQHVERAGVHSGDSISVYPAQTLSPKIREILIEYTRRFAVELKVKGLINVQYVVYNNDVYVIEVNPRSSRTVPYISKVTGVPMVSLATEIVLGKKLKDLGYGTGLYPEADYVAVKVPVFSFSKLNNVDTHLGPEMKSTGEVLGIAKDYKDALIKGLIASGYTLKKNGGVLISVRDADKLEVLEVAHKFVAMGFDIYATAGTALALKKDMIPANVVKGIAADPDNNVLTLLDSGKIDYVISTSTHGRKPSLDSVQIRRKAVERSIVCLTCMDTANAVADCLMMDRSIDDIELVDITKI
ncbi:MAG: ATP-grasp domain-containing protein, partial [Oscillospiraceae bacterium]|nr:ATP-grasp domain-containing protein [Oscillospiraceae bacterium]